MMASTGHMGANMDFTMLEHRTVGILYFISGVLGLAGNLILVLIFLGDKPLSGGRHKLHLHLAIANMMVVAGTPFSGSSAFAGRWLWGELGCQIYGVETYIGGMGVVTFAFLLCVQRFLATSCPEYGVRSSGSSLCILGWLFSIGVAVLPLFGWNTFEIEPSGSACGLNYTSHEAGYKAYFIALDVYMGLMVGLGLLAIRGAFSSSLTIPSSADDWFNDHQLNWIAAANFATAIIGFAPYGYLSIWALVSGESQLTMIASVIPPMVAKLAMIVFPVMYCVGSSKFRDAFFRRVFGSDPSRKEK